MRIVEEEGSNPETQGKDQDTGAAPTLAVGELSIRTEAHHQMGRHEQQEDGEGGRSPNNELADASARYIRKFRLDPCPRGKRGEYSNAAQVRA